MTTVRIIHWYRDPKVDGWLFREDTREFDTHAEAEWWVMQQEANRKPRTFYEIDGDPSPYDPPTLN